MSFAAVLGEIERSAQGRVQVRVIRTNQELMIARSVTGPLNSAETLYRIEVSRNVTQATALTPSPGKTKCGTTMRVRSCFPRTSLDRLAGEGSGKPPGHEGRESNGIRFVRCLYFFGGSINATVSVVYPPSIALSAWFAS